MLLKLCISFLLFSCSFNVSQQYYDRALFYEKQGDWENALVNLDKIIELNENSDFTENALEKSAKIFQETKNYVESEKRLKKLVEVSISIDKKIESMNKLVLLNSEFLNNSEEALLWSEKIWINFAKGRSIGAEWLYNYATLLWEKGKIKKAIEMFQIFIEKYPGHEKMFRSRFYVAEAYYYLGKNKESLEEYDLILEDAPGDKIQAELYYGKALVYEKSGELKKALEELKKARDHYPNKEVVDIKIGGIKKRLKDVNI